MLRTIVFALLSFGTYQVVFFAIRLLNKKDMQRAANRYLACFLVLIALASLESISFVSSLYKFFPFLIGTTSMLRAMALPFFYFHCRALVYDQKEIKTIELLHFTLFIAILVFFFPFLMKSNIEKIQYYDHFLSAVITESELNKDFFIGILLEIQSMTYCMLCLIKVKKEKENASLDLGSIKLRWIYRCSYVLITCFVLNMGLHIGGTILSYLPGSWVVFSTPLFMNILFFVIGYYGLRYPEIFFESKALITTHNVKGLRDNIYHDYYNRIQTYLSQQQIYKDPDVSLTQISGILKIPRKYVSKIINEKYKKNFYDLINEMRIEEVKRNIINKKKTNEPLIKIALEAGFNSKPTFYRVFKEYEKITPMEYAKSIDSRE